MVINQQFQRLLLLQDWIQSMWWRRINRTNTWCLQSCVSLRNVSWTKTFHKVKPIIESQAFCFSCDFVDWNKNLTYYSRMKIASYNHFACNMSVTKHATLSRLFPWLLIMRHNKGKSLNLHKIYVSTVSIHDYIETCINDIWLKKNLIDLHYAIYWHTNFHPWNS